MALGGELSPLTNIGALQIGNTATTVAGASGSAITRTVLGKAILAAESMPGGADLISHVHRCPFFFEDAGLDACLLPQQDFGESVVSTVRAMPHLSADMPAEHRTAHSDSPVVPSTIAKANRVRTSIDAELSRCNI